jgi:hypothetical protein
MLRSTIHTTTEIDPASYCRRTKDKVLTLLQEHRAAKSVCTSYNAATATASILLIKEETIKMSVTTVMTTSLREKQERERPKWR